MIFKKFIVRSKSSKFGRTIARFRSEHVKNLDRSNPSTCLKSRPTTSGTGKIQKGPKASTQKSLSQTPTQASISVYANALRHSTSSSGRRSASPGRICDIRHASRRRHAHPFLCQKIHKHLTRSALPAWLKLGLAVFVFLYTVEVGVE